jgi:hypothetical protein
MILNMKIEVDKFYTVSDTLPTFYTIAELMDFWKSIEEDEKGELLASQ